MKSLFEYIFENYITEGGHAVNGTPMTQPQARAVYKDVSEKFLPKLGLSADGADFCALGSFGKKADEQTSGDIDIAVSVDVIATKNNVSVEEVEQFIVDTCESEKLVYTYGKGIHVISISWPIPDTENYGQVDIMPTTSMDFSKWMYYAPDLRVAESKYKGLYRNQLIMAILKFADQKVLSKTEQNEVIEYERYALRLNSGLARTRRSFMGKKGGLIKTEHALKEFEKQVTNVPDEIVSIAFGDGVTAKHVMTFEQAYELFMAPSFPWKDIRENSKHMKSFCHPRNDMRNEGWFVTLPSHRNGCHVWSVCLQDNTV